jgi:hypothetical protein
MLWSFKRFDSQPVLICLFVFFYTYNLICQRPPRFPLTQDTLTTDIGIYSICLLINYITFFILYLMHTNLVTGLFPLCALSGSLLTWLVPGWFAPLKSAIVSAARDPRLFAAVPFQIENHVILNGSFRTAAPAHGAMPTQA